MKDVSKFLNCGFILLFTYSQILIFICSSEKNIAFTILTFIQTLYIANISHLLYILSLQSYYLICTLFSSYFLNILFRKSLPTLQLCTHRYQPRIIKNIIMKFFQTNEFSAMFADFSFGLYQLVRNLFKKLFSVRISYKTFLANSNKNLSVYQMLLSRFQKI